MTEPVASVRNLGPKMAVLLAEIGVATRSDLEVIGAIEAYRQLRARTGRISLNALYAMQAGLMDVDWRDLPDELKQALREAVDSED